MLQAARALGLSSSTVRYRMVRHGLSFPRRGEAPAARVAHQDVAMIQQEQG